MYNMTYDAKETNNYSFTSNIKNKIENIRLHCCSLNANSIEWQFFSFGLTVIKKSLVFLNLLFFNANVSVKE